MNLIISFTHSNYCIRPTGTEKFIRNVSEIYKKNKIGHIVFFSFYTDSKSVGVIHNDKFQGIYKKKDIKKIIDSYCNMYNYTVKMIHLEHILNFDLKQLANLINEIQVPVCVILHDYYLICNRLKLIDSNNVFCGISKPCEEKCYSCTNKLEGITHQRLVDEFLNEISPFLYKLVAPSKYVSDGFENVYPQLVDKLQIRPHLKLTGKVKYPLVEGKIRLAYVGIQMKEKGFEEWKKLVKSIQKYCPDQYDLFYFGTGTEILEGVTNIYVSTSEQGENAMVEQLRKNKIAMAFVWPNWAETYSYVYYELAVAGVFIVTNLISGNIYSEILINQNGIAFEKYDMAESWIMESNLVKQKINDFRIENSFTPEKYDVNDSLLELICNTGKGYFCNNREKVRKQLLKTILYKVKYRRYLI